jgi:hypothetical protein
MHQLLEESPHATLFAHPRWLTALCRGYPRFRVRYLVLEEGGTATGVVPLAEARPMGLREVVSLPFGTPGGPFLSRDAGPSGVLELVRAFRQQVGGRRTVRFELTVYDPPASMRQELVSGLGPFLREDHTRVLDLTPGGDALWLSYEQQLRRSVRIATRSGVSVGEETGPEALSAFHRLYADQSRRFPLRWHHSRAALAEVTAGLARDARIWLARREGEPLCGQLALYHEGREVHLWLSGAAPESRPVAAFHFLLHVLVQEAAREGYASCNFGSSLEEEGVDRFKRAFGAVERPLLRFYHQERWIDWVQRVRWGRLRKG